MMNRIRQSFIRALKAWEGFSGDDKQMVQDLVSNIYPIKEKTEQMAMALGYAQSCRASIDICKGECCRLHYPKTFTEVDFMVIIEGVTQVERESLTHRILGNRSQNEKCIFLKPDGCFLSFQNRPMVCTNAYPCFASREYWDFKEAGNRKAKPIFEQLNSLFERTIESYQIHISGNIEIRK